MTGWNTRTQANTYMKEYYKDKPWAKTLKNISRRCKDPNHPYYKKGIRNTLTLTQLNFIWNRDKGYLMEKPSIDRIDPKKDYTLDNCRYMELIDNLKRKIHWLKVFSLIKQKYPEIIEECQKELGC